MFRRQLGRLFYAKPPNNPYVNAVPNPAVIRPRTAQQLAWRSQESRSDIFVEEEINVDEWYKSVYDIDEFDLAQGFSNSLSHPKGKDVSRIIEDLEDAELGELSVAQRQESMRWSRENAIGGR